ncbi:MAG: hypothetical protein HY726_15245 [Candidatus Rokubacteria bacterium]|nr:hypothetical protein [Candidatus Rokubacteria bacterium]
MSSLIVEYRRLTVGPEKLPALDAALTLLEKATGLHIRVHRGSVVVTKIPAWIPPVRSWKSLSNLVEKQATGSDGQWLSPRRERNQLLLRIRFLRTEWCLTTLPRHLSAERLPDTQYSFIMESLLLLFHQAYFALLPKLDKAGLRAERDELVSTFFGFAERVPDIAERFRIAGLAYEARADAASAVASFEKALSASHVDEDVFMTRLQTFWMALLDKGDFTAALQLLLKFTPMVSLKQLPELRELILATFLEYGDARTEGGAAG